MIFQAPKFFMSPIRLETVLLTHATSKQFPNPELVMDLIMIYPESAKAMRYYLKRLEELARIMKGADEIVARMAIRETLHKHPNKLVKPISTKAVKQRNNAIEAAETKRKADIRKLRGRLSPMAREAVPRDFIPGPYAVRLPKNGAMTAHEMHYLATTKYGRRWQEPLAELLGVNKSTISRWVNGHSKISEPAARLIRLECTRPETKNEEDSVVENQAAEDKVAADQASED